MKTITVCEPASTLGQTLLRIVTDASVTREVASLAAEAMAADLRLEQWFEDSVKGRTDLPNDSAERILGVWYDVEEDVARAWDEHRRSSTPDFASMEAVLRSARHTMVAFRENGLPVGAE
jgi:hypothetical protein